MKMKKLTALLCVAAMTVSLAACGGTKDTAANTDTSGSSKDETTVEGDGTCLLYTSPSPRDRG